MDFREHEVEWSADKISRFWDFYSHREPPVKNYFTEQVGDAIINLAKKHIPLKNHILDYGTGKGYLLDFLLREDIGEVMGCDFSSDSIKHVNTKFKDIPKFTGGVLVEKLPSSLQARYFDTVFCIEAIEHLTDAYLQATLTEIKRVMASNATLIITTPNDEDLNESKVICPECGAIFHRVQHLRSFNRASLSDLLTSYGFKTLYCNAVHLEEYKSGFSIKKMVRTFGKLFYPSSKPHLFYIGKYNGR